MKKIYVFDMGSVILKPCNLKGLYEELECEISYDELYNLFYRSSITRDVYTGALSDDEYFRKIRNYMKTEKSISELKKLYLKYKGKPYKDTIDYINYLRRNNYVCLLSNLKQIDYEYLSSVVDISWFDRLFLSYEIGYAKPDLKIYEYVINELGTNDFYFFDDSHRNIQNALYLGINAHQITGEDIKKLINRL